MVATFSLENDSPGFVHNPVPSRPIAQLQTDSQFLSRNFSDLSCGANILQRRSERVDNLGAYSIPAETGLIPSDCINYPNRLNPGLFRIDDFQQMGIKSLLLGLFADSPYNRPCVCADGLNSAHRIPLQISN